MEDEQVETALEEQLQSALRLATNLKQENATLSRELDDARQFSRTNSQRNAQWRESWKKELESIEMRERQLVVEEKRWKQRLEDGRVELEGLERQYEMIQDKVVSSCHGDLFKKMEDEYGLKLKRLEEESNKWRASYYEAKQASEQLKAKCDESIGQVNREKEANDALHKTIQSLQESFINHVESNRDINTSNNSENLLRDLKRQLEDRDLAYSSMQETLKAVEKERDEARIAKDSLIAEHLSEVSSLHQQYAKLEATNQVLERRLVSNEKAMNSNAKSSEETNEKLNQAHKEVARLQSCLKSIEESRESEVCKLKHEMVQSTTDASKQLSLLRLSLTEEQEKSKKLQQRCTEIQEHAIKQIKELAKSLETRQDDDSTEKLLIARDEILRLENAVAALQDEKLQINRDHDAECHRLQHAIESCHHEIKLKVMELNEVSKECRAEKSRAEQLQKDLATSDASVKKFEQKSLYLEDEKKNLSALLEENKTGKEKLERDLIVMTREKDEIQQNASEARARADEVKEMLSKEKRRSEAYKEKALEAHRRSVKAKEVLDSIYHKHDKN